MTQSRCLTDGALAAGAAVLGAPVDCFIGRSLAHKQNVVAAPASCKRSLGGNTLGILYAWILHNALREVCVPV